MSDFSIFMSQVWNDVGTALFQLGDVPIAVEGRLCLPDAEENSNPAPGEFSQCSMMFHSTIA
jgi:hypothetical protein